jgi:hypothetical protein
MRTLQMEEREEYEPYIGTHAAPIKSTFFV